MICFELIIVNCGCCPPCCDNGFDATDLNDARVMLVNEAKLMLLAYLVADTLNLRRYKVSLLQMTIVNDSIRGQSI